MSEESLTSGPVDLRAWDEAFRRVESYLRAHGIESRVQLNALASDIIAAAQTAAAGRRGLEPTTLAMQVAGEWINAWFNRVLDATHPRDDRFSARGRLAMILADVPRRWPQHFPLKEAPPEELLRAMNDSRVQAGPEVRFTNMAPRPGDLYPAPSPADLRFTFNRGVLLRAATTWLVIIGLLGVTWAASH